MTRRADDYEHLMQLLRLAERACQRWVTDVQHDTESWGAANDDEYFSAIAVYRSLTDALETAQRMGA